ncbi:hypothetical protein NDU88_001958 [Pleurodeles waltl]|uniref:Uncharacterized protein n=1 Tax=Pleurodeles waltl TaxID=8319 RepID=A0AAV7T0P3_PLEWA|nr:hypothetical protein NDU88_001958 [Pleurodeles waltl]
MKVVKVLKGAVQLEDGRVRNLRHVSLFKASNLSQESVREDLDEESGYLWGYEDERSDRGEGGGESLGGESRNREDDMIPIRKSQRERKLPRHFNEFVMEREDVWCVDRMWRVIDIRSTRRAIREVAVGKRSGSDIAPVMFPHELK